MWKFLSLERKFIRNPVVKDQNAEFMKKYLGIVQMSLVPSSLISSCRYFLPQHRVIKKKITRQLSFESSLTDQRLEILRRDFYMDDLISVDNSVDAAINNMHQTTKILARETPISSNRFNKEEFSDHHRNRHPTAAFHLQECLKKDPVELLSHCPLDTFLQKCPEVERSW
ncbi:GM23261 [Drosophila sechellia]|uniref:GM23261 n=1 Tax=Drosophila sechellia TaxID=7238 RepID=B4ILX2_DROSE|nr:GM23261 [Drosophila sechellia]